MMEDVKDSVMIALLPITTDWCHIDLPHLTLVYAGEKENLKPTAFNEMAKEAASIAMLSRPITLRVRTREMFGNWSDNPKDAVDVFRLQANSQLLSMRAMVEHWNASEFKDYDPHVTIGPVGSFVEQPPMYITFDRIMVGWGKEDLTFWLNKF